MRPVVRPGIEAVDALHCIGNGRRDLLRSAPDVLASTANFLASYGWQRGKDWEPGSANFAVLQQWNKSEVYSKTIGSFATQLARAP